MITMRALIAAWGNTGNEPEVLRQTLECFGCLVLTKYIGRPNDLISILQGRTLFEADIVILSCHGEHGRILMPRLDDSVYDPDEPKLSFSASEITKYLRLSGKTIINTGCTTGRPELAAAFSRQNSYIAPSDYVEGNAVPLFCVDFFYQLIQNQRSVRDAWHHAHSLDRETTVFQLTETFP